MMWDFVPHRDANRYILPMAKFEQLRYTIT